MLLHSNVISCERIQSAVEFSVFKSRLDRDRRSFGGRRRDSAPFGESRRGQVSVPSREGFAQNAGAKRPGDPADAAEQANAQHVQNFQ